MQFKKIKLKDIADINMGQSPSGSSYNNNGRGIPFLQGNKTFGFLYPTIDTWTTEHKKIGKKNSVLMSVRAPVGDLNIANKDICIGRGLCSIEMKNGNNQYLYYLLKNSIKKIKMKSTGTVFDSINRKELENIEILAFNKSQQKKISKVLFDIDKKIELNIQTNDNLFEMSVKLFNNFLNNNKDIENVKLKECVERINTGADAIQRAPIVEYDTGIRCIRIGDMTNNRPYHCWGFTKMTEKDFANYQLLKNDIVITRTAVNGLTYMITDEKNVVCNNGNIRLRVNKKFNPLYIYLYTKTKEFRNYIDRINSETSVRPNMKVEYLTDFLIKNLSLDNQNKICQIIQPLMTKIHKNITENHTLEQMRDTLLPKLMNGEIDLDKIEI